MAEARDPLLPKTTTTGGSNVTPETPGNLFPSQKLKDSCTFTAQFATVESNKAKENLGTKPEGLEKMQKP